jgi:hypothetical protein
LKLNLGSDPPTAATWFLRVASIAGTVAAFVAIGLSVHDRNSLSASLLVFVAVACGVLVAWSWRNAFLAPFERARRYVEGVEGDHRHEWYAFKGLRVRVVLDERQQPWFVVQDIALILDLKADEEAFRHYRPHEFGLRDPAGERCLSETGLRRLIRYSGHRDAGALGLWLEREVLRVLDKREP